MRGRRKQRKNRGKECGTGVRGRQVEREIEEIWRWMASLLFHHVKHNPLTNKAQNGGLHAKGEAG